MILKLLVTDAICPGAAESLQTLPSPRPAVWHRSALACCAPPSALGGKVAVGRVGVGYVHRAGDAFSPPQHRPQMMRARGSESWEDLVLWEKMW